MKKLSCKDIGVNCDAEFTGETEYEIMRLASAHALKEHNLPNIPPGIAKKCRESIVDIK